MVGNFSSRLEPCAPKSRNFRHTCTHACLAPVHVHQRLCLCKHTQRLRAELHSFKPYAPCSCCSLPCASHSSLTVSLCAGCAAAVWLQCLSLHLVGKLSLRLVQVQADSPRADGRHEHDQVGDRRHAGGLCPLAACSACQGAGRLHASPVKRLCLHSARLLHACPERHVYISHSSCN